MRLFRLLAVLVTAFAAVSCTTAPSPIEQSEQSEQSEEPTVATAPSANEYYVRAGEAWDDPDRALSDYSRAIELDPEFALAYFARARIYRGAGDPRAAVRDYDAAIARDPGLVQAYRERGEVRMWDLGDKDGVDDFLMAYELDPDDLRTALAYAGLIAWDDPATAALIYNRMVELYPNRSDSYLARAKFKRDRGDFAAAIQDFQTVLESGNREPWLRAELVMLQLATGDAAAAAAAESLAR
ncbi:MAG TPA: tetratricopeptide repeat protein, partial [Spirochaetia bacterium]|nr:tetratricopeptide repeat protein [Spirochaetia bacterium]